MPRINLFFRGGLLFILSLTLNLGLSSSAAQAGRVVRPKLQVKIQEDLNPKNIETPKSSPRQNPLIPRNRANSKIVRDTKFVLTTPGGTRGLPGTPSALVEKAKESTINHKPQLNLNKSDSKKLETPDVRAERFRRSLSSGE